MTKSQGRVLISPSLLAADFAVLGDEIRSVAAAGADLLHVDVMDGHFVPNLSFGLPLVEAIRRVSASLERPLPLDVHLMITEPERWIDAYVEAGASWLTVHAEASPHLHRSLQQIKAAGARAGVALNPHTPVGVLDHVLELCDHVLVMSVNPGFGGQRFIPEVLPKVEQLAARIQREGLETRIEIDGGIGPETIASAARAGVDVFVAGSAVFSQPSQELRAERVAELRRLAQREIDSR